MAEILEAEALEEAAGTSTANVVPYQPPVAPLSVREREAKEKESLAAEINGFLHRYSPSPSVRGAPDTLGDRLVLKVGQKLPHLSNTLCDAFAVEDKDIPGRKLYALVCPKEVPYRLQNIQALPKLDHPNMVQLVAAGNVEFSADHKVKLVLVQEMPVGKSARQVLEELGSPLPETYIMEHVLAPLMDVIKGFRDYGITHACINLDTVFLGEKVLLGESCSQPAGFAQHYMFESPERAQVMPFGKGEPSIAADCYALGVVVAHMFLGLKASYHGSEVHYMKTRHTLGTFNTLFVGKECRKLEEFFKGVLNDNPDERWTPDQIEQWILGKKSNLMTPSLLREAQRPFDFNGEDYYSRPALAYSIFTHWEDAKPVLRTHNLSRWFEVSLHKPEIADAMRRLVDRTGGINSGSEKANNELVARTILLLDPNGAVRHLDVSCFIDGLGVVLADVYHNRDQKKLQTCVEILEYNFFGYALEMVDEMRIRRAANLHAKQQNAQKYLRMPMMGFGIERVLYDLNPTLPCQSPLLADENVINIDELLQALDRLGKKSTKPTEYLDRHIGAFVASKLDISREVKLSDLSSVPALVQNPQLVILHMLAQAQRKAGKPPLKGFTHWALLRILPLLEHFHGAHIRQKLRSTLKVAAKTGELDRLFHFLADPHITYEDTEGFRKAVQQFARNATIISQLQNRRHTESKAENVGLILAMIIAYIGLLVVVVFGIKTAYF